MTDSVSLRVRIGSEVYHLTREFSEDESEVLHKSEGVMSVVSAIMGSIVDMLWEIGESVERDRGRGRERRSVERENNVPPVKGSFLNIVAMLII